MENEMLRIVPFYLKDKPMIDLRYWINTDEGPTPTKKGVAIPVDNVIRLIRGLQRFYSVYSSEEAHEGKLVEKRST